MSEHRRPNDFYRPALVHEWWGHLGDGRLVAVCEGGHSATELARAMARRAGKEQRYVVTDTADGSSMAWTAESVAVEDERRTGGMA